jgi:hypothetical protein
VLTAVAAYVVWIHAQQSAELVQRDHRLSQAPTPGEVERGTQRRRAGDAMYDVTVAGVERASPPGHSGAGPNQHGRRKNYRDGFDGHAGPAPAVELHRTLQPGGRPAADRCARREKFGHREDALDRIIDGCPRW